MALDVPNMAGFQKLSSTVTLDQEVDMADGDVRIAALTRPLIVSCPDRHSISIWTLTQLRLGLDQSWRGMEPPLTPFAFMVRPSQLTVDVFPVVWVLVVLIM